MSRGYGSVWATGQESSRAQRRGYIRSSTPHPAKTLPFIARHAIGAYSRPGGLVLDPMCGIGTSLVEAVIAGRHAFGIEYEERWAAVADANVYAARGRSAYGGLFTKVVTGDARDVLCFPGELRGQVALVVTSPPYGQVVHGRVKTARELKREWGVVRFNRDYGTDRGNLARYALGRQLAAFTEILSACGPLLTAEGRLVVTARPFRIDGVLVDFPGLVTQAAISAGLAPIERCVALMAAWRNGVLLARPSFFQLNHARKATAAGRPTAVVVHEDVLVFGRGDIDPHTGVGDSPNTWIEPPSSIQGVRDTP